MAGIPDYDIKYVGWKRGGLVGSPQTLRFVQNVVGLALAFEPSSGDPVVAYLGGNTTLGTSVFWFQNDAVISRRRNGVWTETVMATTGDQITCGNIVSDRGFLVGLWPALAFDAAGKMYFAYRDGHDGQFPIQDWGATDVEVWEGNPPSQTGVCAAQSGNVKKGYGGHLQMVIGPNNQPAIIYDKMDRTADIQGVDVLFQRRATSGQWSAPASVLTISNTQTGAALAYDPTEGYGIAVFDLAVGQLSYINSTNGTAWSAADPVFGSGSGGWYPSLSMDPVNHEPAIAFYVCSPRGGVSPTGCNASEDELRVTQRIAGTWRETLVDSEGGYHPKVGFFASGKRFVVYRAPPAVNPATGLTVTNVGVLKLAVEQ
jgi:hypothetical protein